MATLTLTLPQIMQRAVSSLNAGKFDAAEQLCQQIVANNRDSFEARQLLALIHTKVGKKEAALADHDVALTLRPNSAALWSDRGIILFQLGRFHDALASFDRALGLRPIFPEALANRALTLIEFGQPDQALTSCDQALALRPDDPEALLNRGYALEALRRHDEAISVYGRLIALQPDNAEAHRNRAHALLLTGHFHRGWQDYEWRWKTEHLRGKYRNFTQPLWNGTDDIAGKTVLLHAEQGYGDAIQFCRYVPLVAARGVRVVLEVRPPLLNLMTNLAGDPQVIAAGKPLPAFDLHCPLLSLPLAFRTELETIPSTTPYLRPSPEAPYRWQSQLVAKRRPVIGLAWSGSPTHKNDRNRSIGLRSLLPILDCEATFVSLQKDVRDDDAELLGRRGDIHHFADELNDFSDSAALISQLDLVISVDTSVAHLAGALAKPVWILLPHVPDWRWLLDREDSPWYPTARLFRQQTARTWNGVIERVHAELRTFVNAPPAS